MSKFKNEIKASYKLALPLIASYLAEVGLETVDTLMMGHLGPFALAAGALGVAAFFTFFVMGVGLLSSVASLAAIAHAENNHEQVLLIFQQGLVIVTVISIPFMLILWFMPDIYAWLGQPQSVVYHTQQYLRFFLFSMLPFLIFKLFKNILAVFSRAHIVMGISLASIPVGATLNYVLMYGKLGLPALGIAGIGLASVITSWLLVIAVVVYVINAKSIYLRQVFNTRIKVISNYIRKLVKLGWPVAVFFGLEMGLYLVSSVLMGYFGDVQLATHQIALQCTSVVFMIPIAIAQSATIRVATALGAKDYKLAKFAAFIHFSMGLLFVMTPVLLYFIIPKQIVSLFINIDLVKNQQVMQYAIIFLGIAAIFLVFDSFQVIAAGCLRGLKDTFVPMWLGLISYWGVGITASIWFAFSLHWQGIGIWWGLAVGVLSSAVLLLWRLYLRLHRLGEQSSPLRKIVQ